MYHDGVYPDLANTTKNLPLKIELTCIMMVPSICFASGQKKLEFFDRKISPEGEKCIAI